MYRISDRACIIFHTFLCFPCMKNINYFGFYFEGPWGGVNSPAGGGRGPGRCAILIP